MRYSAAFISFGLAVLGIMGQCHSHGFASFAAWIVTEVACLVFGWALAGIIWPPRRGPEERL